MFEGNRKFIFFGGLAVMFFGILIAGVITKQTDVKDALDALWKFAAAAGLPFAIGNGMEHFSKKSSGDNGTETPPAQ